MLRAVRDHDISWAPGLRSDRSSIRRRCGPSGRPTIWRSAQRCRKSPPCAKGLGYRRIGLLLERRGMLMNPKKLYRLYRDEGLSVRRRRGRKRARGTRTPMPLALMPSQRWLAMVPRTVAHRA